MDKADLSGTQDKKIKDFEQGESVAAKSARVEKDYRGTYVPGRGFTGSGSARPGSLAHQSVDKESVQGVKDIVSPMPVDPARAQRQKMTQMQASPTTQKSKEKCIMASMMDKACAADKGYALGEGPKKTSGGGQLWMQHMPPTKKETPRKIDLGTAPKLTKPTQKSAADKATPLEIPQAVKGARLVPDVKPVEKGEKDDDMKTAKSILDEMMEKAGPANDANEPGPVSGTPHGGSGPAQQSTGSMEHPNRGPAQMYVGGSAHAGRGPAQTSTSVNHPNRGPAQMSVGALQGPGNDSQVSKAVTSMSVPRMPRALAAASVEQWRNAPKAGTRINTIGDMSGPLHGELIETVDEHEASPRNPIMKACGSCGRTYTLRKSTDACPTCSNLHRGNMTKSRGGMLIPATID